MDDTGQQLSLLQGFSAPVKSSKGLRAAPVLPVAQVLIDSPLPHLDRLFDYLVPVELDERARPGARVKVRFSGQELPGFLVRRLESPSTAAKLSFLGKVVSPQPVLAPEIAELANQVAARYVGTVSDVVRVAVPPRVAGVEKEFDPVPEPPAATTEPPDQKSEPAVPKAEPAVPKAEPAVQKLQPAIQDSAAADYPSAGLLADYRNGGGFLESLRRLDAPRAVFTSARGHGPRAWPHELADVLLAVRGMDRGAIVVVPDQKDLDRLEQALLAVLPKEEFARLNADDGPTPRYRNFLNILHGRVKLVIGTRAAAYAPVKDLALVCCWDDGDELHIEQRAPYQHVREVLLLRAEQTGAAAMIGGLSRTSEAQRLVRNGWAQSIHPERTMLRQTTPRVINTADSYERERDPLAVKARLPGAAWRAAQEGLKAGPVLVQVARTGYAPNIACQQCREPARCTQCQGPLAKAGRDAVPACRWCARPANSWHCQYCNSQQLRVSAVGAGRTAEELGRAFPSVPVISSAGDHIRATVSDASALVVATPGAEPVAPAGYAAALLLDGQSLLSRESLRAGEDALRRWFTAAALVRSAKDGGKVVITADDQSVVGQLVRWDAAGAADRELAQRQELSLPPSVRVAALTGQHTTLKQLLERAELPSTARIIGPAPLPEAPQERLSSAGEVNVPDQRILVFFPYNAAAAVTSGLRAARSAMSAKKTGGSVQVRCDGVDLI